MSDIVCTSCGYVGEPNAITKGSIWIEVVLWLCFLIPGLIYSMWRMSMSSQQNVCPSCGQTALIPAESPIGKKFISENLPEEVVVTVKNNRPPSKTTRKIGYVIGRFVGRLFK
ncbi:MAG: hypothetical protein PHP70_09875 [Gallionella sp.]|nr:hypothetical protein [Gallionella sp.]